MDFPRARSIAALLVVVAAGTAIAAVLQHRFLSNSGLARTAGVDGRAEWKGFLILAGRGEHRLVLLSPKDAVVDLDGRRVIDGRGIRREARVERLRALHDIRVRTRSAGDEPPRLLWARGEGTPVDVPRILLVPASVSRSEARSRRWVAAVAPFVPFALSLLMLGTAAWGGARAYVRLFGAGAGRVWPWLAVVALLAAGIWWGLPDPVGWAPDELNPASARDALAMGFANGWATLYPPLHFAAFALVNAPFYVCIALGLGEFTDLRFYTLMFAAGRALSLLMAVGIVAVTFGLARELAGTRAAAAAAATLMAALPLTYYAKTANLDVPYVFWFTLSMLFLTRVVRDGRARDYYLLAATATIAVCTKDQAYGYYVLPALYMIAGRWLPGRRRGVPAPRVLGLMVLIVAAGVGILHNVPFNARGFVEHLRIASGPGSEGYRMFTATASGQLRLLGATVREIADSMTWPLLLASLAGFVAAFRQRQRAVMWLLVPAVSYYTTLIAVVGYVYDRFFLGLFVLFAVAAGWWLDRWTRPGVPYRAWRLALTTAVFAYALARVVALDVLMMCDSRYAVERWVLAHASGGDRIVASGSEIYLPRRARILHTMMPQDTAELAALRPDLVIVNPGFSERRNPGSRRHEMYDALRSGAAGYDLVFRHRTHLWWSPLNAERRFTNPDHDQFSNLSKINPVIEVYRRRTAPTPATSSSPPASSHPSTSR